VKKRLVMCAALAVLAGPASAQVLAPQYPGGFTPQFDEDKPWEEQKESLPPYPAQERLVAFEVGPTTSFRFFVDPASVSVGKDGVVRYTLVARSTSGASNISYEGIRCTSRERKLYAFGRADKTWAPARSAQWASIPSAKISPNNQHAALADDFFCAAGGPVRTADEAVAALKRAGRGAR
jgi:hypothetical protein